MIFFGKLVNINVNLEDLKMYWSRKLEKERQTKLWKEQELKKAETPEPEETTVCDDLYKLKTECYFVDLAKQEQNECLDHLELLRDEFLVCGKDAMKCWTGIYRYVCKLNL